MKTNLPLVPIFNAICGVFTTNYGLPIVLPAYPNLPNQYTTGAYK